ncbi:unnamed protein product [Xylocopa violacea]|uniref:Uncharacterized protein n=1 Tax=Xylocopa violacea TaxID=135666 RepID=A0ABP1MWD3_XYLVO
MQNGTKESSKEANCEDFMLIMRILWVWCLFVGPGRPNCCFLGFPTNTTLFTGPLLEEANFRIKFVDIKDSLEDVVCCCSSFSAVHVCWLIDDSEFQVLDLSPERGRPKIYENIQLLPLYNTTRPVTEEKHKELMCLQP